MDSILCHCPVMCCERLEAFLRPRSCRRGAAHGGRVRRRDGRLIGSPPGDYGGPIQSLLTSPGESNGVTFPDFLIAEGASFPVCRPDRLSRMIGFVPSRTSGKQVASGHLTVVRFPRRVRIFSRQRWEMAVRGETPMRRRAFTLIELLVVMAVIGVLVAILLPAVQQAREAARRTTCQSRLKQLGIAVLNYESTHGLFPPGAVASRNGTATTNCELLGFTNQESRAPWAVLLLPYLEQTGLYNKFDFEQPFFGLRHPIASTVNETAQMLPAPAVFQCPSNPNSSIRTNSSYFAVQGGGPFPDCTGAGIYSGRVFFYNGAFHINSATRISDLSDGASSTALVGSSRVDLQACKLEYSIVSPK